MAQSQIHLNRCCQRMSSATVPIQQGEEFKAGADVYFLGYFEHAAAVALFAQDQRVVAVLQGHIQAAHLNAPALNIPVLGRTGPEQIGRGGHCGVLHPSARP
jgi:hypothetical protein